MSKRGPDAPGFQPERDVLFVGLGASAVAYYRCFLPAMTIGCDWVGCVGEPPKTTWVTGLVGKESTMPNMVEDYKVVVLQQVTGDGWNDAIEKMRENGVRVIYEVDDYLHGIAQREDHDFRDKFDKKLLDETEAAMSRCDGLVVSTEFIRKHYDKYLSGPSFVCRNGLDLRRYDLTRPDRPTTNIGWAGATGHMKAIKPWLQQVANVMRMRDRTTFVSIGQGFGQAFAQNFGPARGLAIPFAAIEQYPAAMTLLDVALAPSGKGSWWRGKSDLRWLEAGALGIPVIASSQNYPDIEDGVTGFYAANAMEMAEKLLRLVDDPELRTVVGQQARDVVRETRSIEVTSQDWIEAFDQVL